MELTGSDSSSKQQQQHPQPLTRSTLTIDLNETPSPSETLPSPSISSSAVLTAQSPTSIVLSFHDNPAPPDGLPADIPGEGHGGSACGACGKSEVRGHVVVCDGCERGFHLGCAGMRGREAASMEEWVCGECLSGGVGSRRWPLGMMKGGGDGGTRCANGGGGGVRLLDMNASPPSEGGGDGCEEKESGAGDGDGGGGAAGGGLEDGFPVQYEDFFVVSLGKVDSRPSYHDHSHIWPVGYRSCWHDKITGSLFICDVVEDGDTGPLFKVSRYSCSSFPIPYGSTVLYRQRLVQVDGQKDEHTIESTVQTLTFDGDSSIATLLSDPCLPADDNVVLWLGNNSDSASSKAHSICGSAQDLVNDNVTVGDKIGKFSINGRSSSLLWKIISQRVTTACCQIYKQTGFVKFFCKHVEYDASQLSYVVNEKDDDAFSSLNKFLSLFGAIGIPAVIKSDNEFELAFESLRNWLSIDRFGLDAAFVQEMLEQLPAVRSCSLYECMRSRNCGFISPMVGNGLLLTNGKSRSLGEESALVEKRCQHGLTSIDFNHVEVHRSPPPGKFMGSRLPPHIVGDVLQVWEELGRFHEILGLEMAPSFDELESELIIPWFEGICCKRDYGRVFQEDRGITSSGSRDLGQTASSSREFDHRKEHSDVMDRTEGMREELLFLPESSTYHRCTGLLLRTVQISLLNVLMNELKLKIAAVVDPTSDVGESKPRRGRRREVVNSNTVRRSSLSMLPINDYTLPELTRRYLLAVLCMDGNCESPEAAIRESSKIFRCLQGDGGVLCGSLPGVAGIEADAIFLAESMKRIYGSPNGENDILVIEDDEVDSTSCSRVKGDSDDVVMPEWAQALEPVRKLPTNVGTRIRRCVYEALEKDPPEWARKILEHSISKEVYKGNASGPTKKAVLSVLADVLSEGLQPKAHVERKRKTVLSKSDVIMKKCRIVLRHAISADEDKLFCNLLGRSLTNSSENDEEGLLGSPAMVSRPLDFRTVDFRLAVGAYCGSHEAFLEDVRELWRNVRIAHADQPDLVQVAETLSQNFESLYEKEVISLLRSLEDCSESNHVRAEAMRDLLVSVSEIPKAPWDEGVCKVCGIDKDDDAVLLCDTCDAEYHTYCLNPPLTRIPEGNWYCPSCVSGASVGALKIPQVLGHSLRKKYLEEGADGYLGKLTQLAMSIEENEYWEFSVEERALLLKFLCDELLNSVQIRQHLEQCAEIFGDLQQKLRSLHSEVKILKVREDVLMARASQAGRSSLNASGESKIEHLLAGSASNGSGLKPEFSDTSLTDCPTDTNPKTVQGDSFVSDDINRHLNSYALKKHSSCNGQVQNPASSLSHLADVGKHWDDYGGSYGNHTSNEMPQKHLKIIGPEKAPFFCLSSQEINGVHSEILSEGQRHDAMEREASSTLLTVDLQGVPLVSTLGSIQQADCPHEASSFDAELNTVKKELVLLRQSIADIELRLLNMSLRREFLGSDSFGGLYWISSMPGGYSMVLSDRTIALDRKKMRKDKVSTGGIASVSSDLAVSGKESQFEGSNVSCPFVYAEVDSVPVCSQWVSYRSDAEVMELIEWLNGNDPKEKELKDAIVRWQNLKSFAFCQTEKVHQDKPLPATQSKEEVDYTDCVATKAALFLQKKFGPWYDSKEVDGSKKRWTRARANIGERMCRCKCLEPIWPSRYHCLHCHKTFLTAEELQKHNVDKCCSSSTPDNKKLMGDSSASLILTNSESGNLACGRTGGVIEGPESAASDLSSSFIKFCSDGLMSPYSFEEISSKFVTNDSVKDLVQDIGLISSGGIPTLIWSLPSHFDDPGFMLSQEGLIVKNSVSFEVPVSLQDDNVASKTCISDDSSGKPLRKYYQNLRTEWSLPRTQESGAKKCSSNSLEISHCCTVPEASLRPLVGKSEQILKQLKISLIDIEAALPEEALRPSKVDFRRRCLWRAFVKRAVTIFEIIQAAIVMEDMIKTEYLRNEWWYWSSLSAAVKTSTLSALALRIYSLDNAIVYDKTCHHNQANDALENEDSELPHSQSNMDPGERSKLGRRVNKKRKEADG